jgi:hypothetical protein
MSGLERFSDIPTEVRRRLAGGERVLLILLDALGLEFLERHREHRVVKRLEVHELRSQFPSTTTAHVTTAHFGLPVEEHGLYEWNVLEPSLNRIICPLRFAPAEGGTEGLRGILDPAILAPGPTFYESLDAASLVAQPEDIIDTSYTRLATRGAALQGFTKLERAVGTIADAFTRGCRYAFLYWDGIDRAGHVHGPGSREFTAACLHALDALARTLPKLRDATILVTADHGMVDVRPDRVDYLDELWPELPALLRYPRPAGSSRDAFLHVSADHVQSVIDELSERLGPGADVRRASEHFGAMGPRLSERLGDVAVLAAPGRQVWLKQATANETWFRGQHGGLEPAEIGTYLAEFVV